MDKFWIMTLIYCKETSAAYIIPESKGNILLRRDEMVENGQNLFHVIKFNLGKIQLVYYRCEGR